MAEAVLSSLLSVIFERLSSQIFDEYGFLQGTDKERTKLQSLLSTIQSVLKDAEQRDALEKAVKDWLIKLKDVAYDADDLLDEYMTEVLQQQLEFHDHHGCDIKIVCNFVSQSNPILCHYRMKRKLKDIVERLNTIADERFKFHLRENFFDVHCKESTERLQTDSYLHASEVFGRDEEKENIISFLMDPSDDLGDVSILPVVGMGGLGKTTLAKLVFNDRRVEQHFERRIWVCVPEEFDVKKIMRAIIESATGSRCDLLEMEATHRRVQELLMKKRFLLVLDDVWNEDHEKWDRLKNSMRHGSGGSKVLVTTRSEKVALIMGTVSPYRLKGLSDENCWLLFQKRAFNNGKPEENTSLAVIGKEIARKCKGVPLAAKALGRSLALKGKSEWLNVQNSEMWNFIGEENGILPVLRLSYSNLPSHLKQCFAYCSLFPKNYRIKKENLIQLWMAEGFIQPTQGKQLEEVANECFDELLSRSFFQNAAKDSNGDIVECEMHHLLHDLAKTESGNSCLMLDVWQQPIIPSCTRHLSVLCNEIEKLKFLRDNMKLRSLLILSGQITKLSGNLIMRMKCLRALDISSTRIKKLSKSIGSLKHLRYLNLSHTHLNRLPDSICSLFNLQTLLLQHCIRLEKLPKDLRKLIKLRHLNIYGCGLLTKLPNGIGELTSLKTLPTFIVGNGAGCGILELKSLDLHGELKITNLENIGNGIGSVKDTNLKDKRHIHSLKLVWDDVSDVGLIRNVDGVIEALQPNSELEKLTIENYMGSTSPSWLMNHYLTNLVELSLIKCCRCVLLPSLQNLPALEVLTIDEMDAIMYFCSDSNNNNNGVVDIASLKRLSLKSVPNLLGWSSAEGRGLLSSLKELKVEDAPNLISLPNLPSIEYLELIYCSEDILVDATKMTSPSNIILGGFGELVHFPQGLLSNKTCLLSLEIKDCTKLVNFSGELKSLSFLQSLSISNCPNIKCLSELVGLKALKSLSIDRCPGLISFLEEEIQGSTSLQHFSLSNCENITALPYTMQHFINLQTLYIWSCPKIVGLPEWLGKLVSLRELELWYCDSLLHLPESMKHLTGLQFLSIWGCPQLTADLEDRGPDWHKIQHIPFIKINGPYIQAIS